MIGKILLIIELIMASTTGYYIVQKVQIEPAQEAEMITQGIGITTPLPTISPSESPAVAQNLPQDEPLTTDPTPDTPPAETPTITSQPTPQIIIYIQQPTPSASPTPQAQTTPEPSQDPVADAPKKMRTIEIINPIPGKGQGRQYVSKTSEELTEQNYIELGALIRNENGNPIKDATVTITATEESQNKIITATGNVTNIFVNGQKQQVPYYHYHYEFNNPGHHTITFTCDELQSVVELDVTDGREQ